MKYKLNHKFSLSKIQILDYVYDEESLTEALALYLCTDRSESDRVHYPSDKEIVSMKQKAKDTTEVLYLVTKDSKIYLVTESELEDLNKQTCYLYQANYNNLINSSIYNTQKKTPRDLEVESRSKFRDSLREHLWSDLMRTTVVVLSIIGSIKMISVEPIVGMTLLLLNTIFIVLWRVSIYTAILSISSILIDYCWSAWDPDRFKHGGAGGLITKPDSSPEDISFLRFTRLLLLVVSIGLLFVGLITHLLNGFHETTEPLYWRGALIISMISSLPIVIIRILIKRR